MADDHSDPPSLYDTDVLAWSEQQAAALRDRRFGGNVLDWDNIAEEIEDVGKNVYRACQSQVDNILTHLIKIEFIGPEETIPHWEGEVVGFRAELQRDLTRTIENRLKPELDGQLALAIKRLVKARRLPSNSAVEVKGRGYTWEQITDEDWYPEPRLSDPPLP